MTFGEKVEKLEKILEKIESGKTSLEETNKLFEEGVELAKECFSMLEESKGKITVLKAELDKLIEQPLE